MLQAMPKPAGDDDDGGRAQIVSFQHHAVHEAMVFCAETDAYFQAVAYCPTLIETESPHDMYLSFCEYNVWDASQRLANYWTLRVELFRKPFVPLLETMLEQDLEFFELGGGVILPRRTSDGVFVVMTDRYRVCSRSRYRLLSSRLRFAFYVLAAAMVIANQEGKSCGEVVVLIRVNTERFAPLLADWKHIKVVQRILTSCVCTRLLKNYMISVNPPQGVITRVFGNALGKNIPRLSQWLGAVPSEFHVGSRKEILASLEAQGFAKDGLPTTMGGDWRFEVDWPLWISRQQQRLTMAQSPQSSRLDVPYCQAEDQLLRASGDGFAFADVSSRVPIAIRDPPSVVETVEEPFSQFDDPPLLYEQEITASARNANQEVAAGSFVGPSDRDARTARRSGAGLLDAISKDDNEPKKAAGLEKDDPLPASVEMIMKARRETRRQKTAAYTRKYRAKLKQKREKTKTEADAP